MTNPSEFLWTEPTQNVDGTPIAAGEITGYNIGIRLTTASGSVAGSYPTVVSVPGPTTQAELFAMVVPTMMPGIYAAAIQTVGPVDSAYSSEITFTIAPPQPLPPTGFKVG